MQRRKILRKLGEKEKEEEEEEEEKMEEEIEEEEKEEEEVQRSTKEDQTAAVILYLTRLSVWPGTNLSTLYSIMTTTLDGLIL